MLEPIGPFAAVSVRSHRNITLPDDELIHACMNGRIRFPGQCNGLTRPRLELPFPLDVLNGDPGGVTRTFPLDGHVPNAGLAGPQEPYDNRPEAGSWATSCIGC